jgi:ectoine hydroxylase-related dioxygenase (phytanoyl-CoA dioxygenase family)
MDILTYSGINDTMADLIGEPAAVHLNLTGWITTRRNWHQDTYLNPPSVGDYYVAVWIALETIHPDSGPFQFVRGSHRWRTVTRDKILSILTPQEQDHRWPKFSERILTPVFEHQIQKRNAEVITYLPERGDVLFWHGRLLHRGSEPNIPGMMRKSLIAHYSGINHRQDMPEAVKHGDGWYFPIDGGNVS